VSADLRERPEAPRPEANRAPLGLTTAEATGRLHTDGPNEIQEQHGPSSWMILARQFQSPVIWLLTLAGAAAMAAGESADTVAILVIVAINGIVGFLQEQRAERALTSLRAMTAPRARVLRDGHSVLLPARDVVRGDALLLEAGDVVPADARIIDLAALAVNEASLTGESLPVEKSVEPDAADALLAERRNAVFMGTSIVRGTAVAEVTAIGMQTELGRIAGLLAGTGESATPLQRRLAQVTRQLVVACSGIVALVALLGWIRGGSAISVFLSAVSLAVAAVPEGLPAIVTIALALGVQRMASRHVLIRRLPAVEALGCASVICTDKTGTLTTGVMTVRELWGRDHHALLFAAAACCDAELQTDARTGVGDPTEVAILRAAAERGITRDAIERERPRVWTTPFDAETKRMSILRADGVIYVKGALEVLLAAVAGDHGEALRAHAELAERGLRVLAVATGSEGEPQTQTQAQPQTQPQALQLLGLIGIADPPRTEAIEAVAAARRAGITTVMITGDHPVTAHAIARELGIVLPGESAEGLVHARTTPEEKLRIVQQWRGRGAVVAMTGDGVNDAPALREADIGIAMGKTGTQVTRDASDMILADDNFASIVAAVREGRGIFDNIRRTLVYLLSGNAAELAVMLAAAIAGLPLPLLPLQLLWINIVTDGLPALALVMEPTADDVLRRPPRKPEEPLLGGEQWRSVAVTALLQTGATLLAFGWGLYARNVAEARTLAFAVLVFGELFRSFAARSDTRLFWQVGALTNVRLLAVVLISGALQVALHQLPATQQLFQIGALTLQDWAGVVVLGLMPVTVIELRKLRRQLFAFPQRFPVDREV
jgi:Ca2+-transporting ATPase